MLDTEEFRNWLESRRLIITRLTAMEAGIRELDDRIDRYNEVSREKTFDLASKSEAGIADLRLNLAARSVQAQLWSAVIGLVTGGIATTIVELLVHHFGE